MNGWNPRACHISLTAPAMMQVAAIDENKGAQMATRIEASWMADEAHPRMLSWFDYYYYYRHVICEECGAQTAACCVCLCAGGYVT
jgi:hypothetical protein